MIPLTIFASIPFNLSFSNKSSNVIVFVTVMVSMGSLLLLLIIKVFPEETSMHELISVSFVATSVFVYVTAADDVFAFPTVVVVV